MSDIYMKICILFNRIVKFTVCTHIKDDGNVYNKRKICQNFHRDDIRTLMFLLSD